MGLRWPCDKGKAQQSSSLEPLIAERKQEQDDVLKIRSNIYTALKEHILDSLDVSVPPGAIGKLIEFVHEVERDYKTTIPVYGHVADSNLHVHGHIMDDVELSNLKDIEKKIYEKTIELGGTITAEHGIGKVRRGLLTMAMDEKCMELSRAIKNALDPESILNPDCKI